MKTKIKVYTKNGVVSKIVSDNQNFEIEMIENGVQKSFGYTDIKTFEDACEKLNIRPIGIT